MAGSDTHKDSSSSDESEDSCDEVSTTVLPQKQNSVCNIPFFNFASADCFLISLDFGDRAREESLCRPKQSHLCCFECITVFVFRQAPQPLPPLPASAQKKRILPSALAALSAAAPTFLAAAASRQQEDDLAEAPVSSLQRLHYIGPPVTDARVNLPPGK